MLEQTAWEKSLKGWPLPLPEFDIDLKKTALVIIDMAYFNVHPDLGIGKLLTQRRPDMADYYLSRLKDAVIPNNVKLLEFFRSSSLRVLFTATRPPLPDGSDLPPYWKARDATLGRETERPWGRGPDDWRVIDELKPRTNELVIKKISNGAFNGSNIDQVLRNMGIDTLVFTGVATNGCVQLTALDASDKGYNCIVVDDACATFEQAAHDATLITLARVYTKVKLTDELIAELTELIRRPSDWG